MRCPWCWGSDIDFTPRHRAGEDGWFCLCCKKRWNGRLRDGRWLIKVPVATIPWRSGTVADLACGRRAVCGFSPGNGNYGPTCCRWPKACRAFDPGYTEGKGPTTLPVIWNDGFGWRSGAPDITAIPPHLVEQTLKRWIAADLDRRGIE
jgi:hypothetical protein